MSALPQYRDFKRYAFLRLNPQGRFIDGPNDRPVPAADLNRHFEQTIRLQHGVSDVFIWVHGWKNTSASARLLASRMFGAIEDVMSQPQARRYESLQPFKPCYVAVHWPSNSSATPQGYARIRDLAAAMTVEGDAARFLGALLGYLGEIKPVQSAPRLLRARAGFRVHCVASASVRGAGLFEISENA